MAATVTTGFYFLQEKIDFLEEQLIKVRNENETLNATIRYLNGLIESIKHGPKIEAKSDNQMGTAAVHRLAIKTPKYDWCWMPPFLVTSLGEWLSDLDDHKSLSLNLPRDNHAGTNSEKHKDDAQMDNVGKVELVCRAWCKMSRSGKFWRMVELLIPDHERMQHYQRYQAVGIRQYHLNNLRCNETKLVMHANISGFDLNAIALAYPNLLSLRCQYFHHHKQPCASHRPIFSSLETLAIDVRVMQDYRENDSDHTDVWLPPHTDSMPALKHLSVHVSDRNSVCKWQMEEGLQRLLPRLRVLSFSGKLSNLSMGKKYYRGATYPKAKLERLELCSEYVERSHGNVFVTIWQQWFNIRELVLMTRVKNRVNGAALCPLYHIHKLNKATWLARANRQAEEIISDQIEHLCVLHISSVDMLPLRHLLRHPSTNFMHLEKLSIEEPLNNSRESIRSKKILLQMQKYMPALLYIKKSTNMFNTKNDSDGDSEYECGYC